jgi:trans-aconitate methyltransferase
MLNNRHEYGTPAETLELLKPCNKGMRMNCWETLYIQAFQQNNTLINEQQVSDINPLQELADKS